MKITTLILTHHPNPILGYKVIKSAPHVRIHWKTKNLSKISLRTKTIATNWASSSTLKNPKYSSHSKASEIINEQNQDLGFAAGAEQVQQLLDSLVYGALGVWVRVKTVENFGSVLVCWVSGCWVAGFGFVDGDGMGGRRRRVGRCDFQLSFFFMLCR